MLNSSQRASAKLESLPNSRLYNRARRPWPWLNAHVVLCWLATLVFGFGVMPCQAQTATPSQERESLVSYQLHAALQEPTPGHYVIEGRGTITIVNNSSRALVRLPLHLYMNAFTKGSLALGLPFLDSRAALFSSEQHAGSIEILAFRDQRDGSALELDFATPQADRTTAEVVLEQPIEPATTAGFELAFTTRLPLLSQRTGSAETFVFAGQWFPKLAKLEPDGTWAQFVFHPQAEFYANFGHYDVTLDTPRGYVVGASGTLHSQTQNASRQTARYTAEQVHDFAWTAWPEFETHEFLVDDTSIRLLYPPGQTRNREITVLALQKALPWFESWLGAYPLPTLTVVHPPHFARAASGMEYPGLITTGGSRLAGLVSDDVERVVIHELAHQWFYGLVGSNEYTWPFLDEGLSTYAENRALRELYTDVRDDTLRLWTTFDQYTNAHAARHDAAITNSASAFTSFGQLAALAYDRAALVFETFARVHGPVVDAALGEYARNFAHRHPAPHELFQTFKRHLNPSAVATLRTALEARGWVNYRVQSLEHTNDPTSPSRVLNRVVVNRQGPLHFPTTVVLTEYNGQVHTKAWDNDNTQHELSLVTQTPIVLACVDPELHILLDDEPADNCQRLTPPSPPPHWVQLVSALQALVVAVGL